MIAERVESRRTKQTSNGTQEEEKEHKLLLPRQLADGDIVLKQLSDVVAEYIHSKGQESEEDEPHQVCPYVPCLGVEAEHALHATFD